MVKNKVISIGLAIACLIFGMACSDENDEIIPEPQFIEVSESELIMPVTGRYYSLTATAEKDLELAVASDADWLILGADSVATDGSFEFYICENPDELGRDASIHIYVKADPSIVATVKVHQRGPNESDTNEGGSVYDRFRLGYGYNIFKNYMDDNSKTLPILDTGNPVVLRMMQMALSSKEEVEHISANTIEEMAQLLTTKETKESSSKFGSKNTSYRFAQNGTLSKEESWYSYIRLYRTCASAGLDMGMLQQQLDRYGSRLFTEEFQTMYENLTKDRHQPTNDEIDQLLKTYGTHLIVSSELGGSMDVTLNFKRTMTGSLNIRAEDFADYFFYGENSEFDKNDICTNIQSNEKDASSTFKIVGGSRNARETIRQSINGEYNRIKTADLLAWQNSLDLSSINDIGRNEGAVPINFHMIPIATLFPDYLQKFILSGLLRMAEQDSNNTLNDLKAGTDKYMIPLKGASFMNFPTSNDASLVRVLYASHQPSGEMLPTLEICNEYVPVIRGDKRITVVYAIRNGRTFHGAGLFPGDGEGNPPAWLTFSEGKVYVDPIKKKTPSATIDTVYFMHGNIYETDLGLRPPKPRRSKVEDHYCEVIWFENATTQTAKIPCVKIGSGYWFRSNSTVDLRIVMHLDDMFDDGDSYEYSETHPTTHKYYAGLYGDMNREFLGFNHEYIGKDKWFLPTPTNVNDLCYYMGNNTKAFFKGQVSGFNAEFDGYFGQYDVRSGKRSDRETFRYVGEVCCVACRTDWDRNGNAKGAVMLLWPDYSIGQASDDFCDNGYFPVRLYRNSNYQYLPKNN